MNNHPKKVVSRRSFPPRCSGAASPWGRKRGSVLILVVALLVLMALIGTAWISTARVDRTAAIQNVNNTQIDLFVDGVVNMATARLIADVYNADVYRRSAGYNHFDDAQVDDFLASRIPVLRDEVTMVWRPGPLPTIPGDSWPTYLEGRVVQYNGHFYLCKQTHRASANFTPGASAAWQDLGVFDLNTPFDPGNPPVWPAISRVLPPDTRFTDIEGRAPDFTERGGISPVSKQLVPGGPYYPAFEFYPAGRPAGAPPAQVLAADTDGDGIADAAYFRLPVGRLNGLDYYAAIRIVDNNAAANASTAFGNLDPSVANFPSSLNIHSLIIGPNQTAYDAQRFNLNRVRFNRDPTDDFSARDMVYAPFDPPVNDLATTNLNDRRRTDFVYNNVEEIFQSQFSRRPSNPGYWSESGSNFLSQMRPLSTSDTATLAYRGGPLINIDSMNTDLSPSAQIEQVLNTTLYYSAPNHPSASNQMARRSSYPQDQYAWRDWFGRNHDWRQLWSPEQSNTPDTYRNRRPLIVTSNGVTNAFPNRYGGKFAPPVGSPAVPGGVPTPGRGSDWLGVFAYDVGDFAFRAKDGTNQLYVCISPVPLLTNVIPPGDPPLPALAPGHPRQVVCWEPQPFDTIPTKASATAGSYGQLFLAYWHTMAETGLLSVAPTLGAQTPFRDAWRAVVTDVEANATPLLPAVFDSPYYGTRFVAPPVLPTPVPAVGTFAPEFDPADPTWMGTPNQHPLRMFRSPLRVTPAATGAPYGPATPRMMTDHTMRLRAALAAVNTIDMRDNDDDVTVRELSVGVTFSRGASAVNIYDDVNVLAKARVYGHEKQPYLTEVFAHTATDAGSAPAGAGGANTNGYVAIELHNPYPFPIDLRNCKIGTIDRAPGSHPNLVIVDPQFFPELAPILSGASSNMAVLNTDPLVIPPNGFLVLENYKAQAAAPLVPGEVPAAAYRPAASGLPAVGPIPMPVAGGLVRNHAYVPNLHTVLDKEMVLLRPLFTSAPGTTGPNGSQSSILGVATEALRYSESAAAIAATTSTPAMDMAPLDSYDFTGIPNPDPVVTAGIRTVPLRANPTPRPSPTYAHAWHYARAYDPATKAWRFVYPGRYDAHQSVNTAVRRPRQQGTYEAGTGAVPGWDPGTGALDPWDIANVGTPTFGLPDPRVTLAEVTYLNSPLYAPTPVSVNATYYPYEYAIQLTNALLPYAGNIGAFPVAETGGAGGANHYPFGGFARNGDILQVPYMGAYRIQITNFSAAPPVGRDADSVPVQITTVPNQVALGTVFEINPITMDSVFAEDTDPSNHYNPVAGLGAISRPEQVGRFTPSLEDMQVLATGTIDDASPVRTNPILPGPGGWIDDGERVSPDEPAGAWNRYEMVITDGPGKGQVRTVISSATNGRLVVSPDWEANVIGCKYILRKGTLWRDPVTTSEGFPNRTHGNKAWATDLFEYVTIDTPQNDHFPMADPAYGGVGAAVPPPQGVHNTNPRLRPSFTYGRMTGGSGSRFDATVNLFDAPEAYRGMSVQFVTGPAAATGEVQVIAAYDSSGTSRTLDMATAFGAAGPTTEPLPGDVFRIFGMPEDQTPTQGLVNINTAPWPVLALLPFAPGGDPGSPAINAALAQAICRYRDGDPSAGIIGHGPFQSIFDLYRVPEFVVYQNSFTGPTTNPDDKAGDWTPDTVRFDFEEQYLLLNRISNMITTRSDSFTVYVLVQGWRGGGTTTPELVVQRRRAFTADRTGLSQTARDLSMQFLYND